jgi:hypothetical protein
MTLSSRRACSFGASSRKSFSVLGRLASVLFLASAGVSVCDTEASATPTLVPCNSQSLTAAWVNGGVLDLQLPRNCHLTLTSTVVVSSGSALTLDEINVPGVVVSGERRIGG